MCGQGLPALEERPAIVLSSRDLIDLTSSTDNSILGGKQTFCLRVKGEVKGVSKPRGKNGCGGPEGVVRGDAAVRMIAQDLPSQGLHVLAQTRITAVVANADVQHSVRAERKSTALVIAARPSGKIVDD